MNSNFADEKLDDILNQWADETVSRERLQRLHDRLVSSLVDSATVRTTDTKPQQNGHRTQPAAPDDSRPLRMSRSRWASGIAVGTVVTMLLLLGFQLAQWNQPGISSSSDLPPEYAWLREEQIQNKALLLAEMEILFDQHLAWVAETGDRLEFGLDRPDPSHVGRPDGRRRLAVRVVVERRQPGHADWQLAWAMDVVSQDEQVIRVAPREANGNELRLWTYRLPDGAIAVDSEVQLAGRNPFRASTSGLHHNREPVKVVTAHNNGTEYRVFQTVAMLDGKVI